MIKKVTKSDPVVDENPKKKTAVKKAEAAAPAAKVTKKAEPKAATKKTDDNTMSLSALCSELSIDPRYARIKLRKSDFKQTDGTRWAWVVGSKELAAVTKYLTAPELAKK